VAALRVLLAEVATRETSDCQTTGIPGGTVIVCRSNAEPAL